MSATPIIYAAAVLILATSVSLCLGMLLAMLAGAWITFAARTGVNPVGGLTDQFKKLFSRTPKVTDEPDEPKARGPVAKP